MLDVFSRYVVGWMVAHRETATLAQTFIGETCARQGIDRGQLTIHADRGPAMPSKSVALLLADLGVKKTHGRPHVCNDNPLAEAAFDQHRLGRALNDKVRWFSQAGDLGAALQAGLRALAIGESQADVAIQVVANNYLGTVYRARGEYREGVRHCGAALALIPEGLAHERFGQATSRARSCGTTLPGRSRIPGGSPRRSGISASGNTERMRLVFSPDHPGTNRGSAGAQGLPREIDR